MRRYPQLVLLLLAAGSLAAQQPPPLPFDAKNYAQRDSHQGVTIAADPYLEATRAKTVFADHAPNRVGVLPVELIVTNDSEHPVRIAVERSELILSRKRKLEPAPIQKVMARLYSPDLDATVSLPVPRAPLPRAGKRKRSRKDVEAAEADFRSKQFQLRVIPPHSSAKGFLFFDLGPPFELSAGAVLYLPEVVDQDTGQPLLYFEITLVAASSASPAPQP